MRCSMTIKTYEGNVENGKIVLTEEVILPENVKVYVIITNEFNVKINREKPSQILSPHLAKREDAKKFEMKVTRVKRK